MGIITKVKEAVGEMFLPFGNKNNNTIRVSSNTFSTPYTADDTKVDYQAARSLYNNTLQSHKLGAAFIKPIVNSTVGFMGVPQFRSEDEEAQEILDNFVLNNTSNMLNTHNNALKLGDCFIWLTREERNPILYPEDNGIRIVYNIIPPEQVKEIIKNPVTGEIVAYKLESKHTWTDLNGARRKATVTQTLTAKERIIKVDGDTMEGLSNETIPNHYGFIPIIHFKNEPDEISLYGKSEIEPILPYVKAYNDVLHFAMKSSKMNSSPKLALNIKDAYKFIQTNLGIADPKKFIAEGGKINLDGHEVLFLSGEDKAEIVEVRSATGDSQVLLKILFYCIVDISETPEFIFGVHTPSALASVKEQMPIMINKVKRKREQVTGNWQLLARMVLAMEAHARGYNFSTNAADIIWDEVDPRDEEKLSTTLKNTADALKVALDAEIISREAATNHLASLVDTINEYTSDNPEVVGEREKIISDRRLENRLMDNQGWVNELEAIEKQILELSRKEGEEVEGEEET